MAGRLASATAQPSTAIDRDHLDIGAGSNAARQPGAPLPLVVDLDAGFLSPAFVPELVICALRHGLRAALPVLAAAVSPRASLDAAIARSDCLRPGAGLLDEAMLAVARTAKAEGRDIVLMTRAYPALARRLSATQGWSEEVIVVGGHSDLAELSRLAAVRARCPEGFVTLPDADATALWVRAGRTYASAPLKAVQTPAVREGLTMWMRAARLHQWMKNLLLFLPLILAGRALDPASWLMAAVGFLSFGLVASATYLLNDLHDLEHDRAHRSKRHRPLASGHLTIPAALLGIIVGLALGIGLAAAVGHGPALVVTLYLGLTLTYTFLIKRVVMLDAMTLAALFTLRLMAGVVFCGVAGSPWLFVLSMFLFTSLALAKRFAEIRLQAAGTGTMIAGRGYLAEDGPVVLAFGTATAAAAVLIVSLYIFEAAARQPFYLTPGFLWAAPIAVFLWLARVWILCGRGTLHDDPVEFALRDRVSLGLGAVAAASFCLACLPL